MGRTKRSAALSTLAAASAASALAATVAVPPAVAAQTTTTVAAPPPTFAAAVLVDVDTGRVLFAQNANTPMPPASLTKVLTAMIAADWLPADAQIPVTPDAFNVTPDKVGMKPGQSWPIGTVLHALITDSANDAAYALAVDIGGSLPGFAAVMQDAARQIGMTDDPVLEDPAGLDGSDGVAGGNRISAWDLATAGRDMMANPELATIAAQQTYNFDGPDQIPYHIVSRNLHFLRSFPGAIGVKTGFTDAAGYCDMEEAEQGGRRMLAVVLHSTNPDTVAASLITSGFATPAAAEASDPLLPAISEPTPAPPPRASATEQVSALPRKVVTADAPLHQGRNDAWLQALGVAALVGGIGIGTFRLVRARTRERARD